MASDADGETGLGSSVAKFSARCKVGTSRCANSSRHRRDDSYGTRSFFFIGVVDVGLGLLCWQRYQGRNGNAQF